jgi:hypothetical protein
MSHLNNLQANTTIKNLSSLAAIRTNFCLVAPNIGGTLPVA